MGNGVEEVEEVEEGVEVGAASSGRSWGVQAEVASSVTRPATSAVRRRVPPVCSRAMAPWCHPADRHPLDRVNPVSVGAATLEGMRPRIALTACAAVALVGVVAAPAHAEFYSIDDPADASASLTDVQGLEANHGSDNLLVKVRFNELMRSSAAGVSVFVDTDRDEKGPEFVLSSGLGDGTDYVLTEADAWRGSERRVDCDYSARPRWGRDVFRAVISRDCFDRAASVRVSVRMVDEADGSHLVVDWAPRRHRWSLPIGAGLSA